MPESITAPPVMLQNFGVARMATPHPGPLETAVCTTPCVDTAWYNESPSASSDVLQNALNVGVDLFRREVHRQAARRAREDARMLHGAHGLPIQASIVDRDRGVIREREQQLLVMRVEAALGRIEHADRADHESVGEARNGDHVARVGNIAQAFPLRVLARGGDVSERLVIIDREVAWIAVCRSDHHGAVLHQPQTSAAGVEQLRGMTYDESEYPVELERLIDALHDLGERARLARTLLETHERNVVSKRRQARLGGDRIGRAASHFFQQFESQWKTSARRRRRTRPHRRTTPFAAL